MTEEILKTLRAFEDLPKTEAKEALSRSYLNDEITNYEFVNAAREFIKNPK